jgi:hypothetical protein
MVGINLIQKIWNSMTSFLNYLLNSIWGFVVSTAEWISQRCRDCVKNWQIRTSEDCRQNEIQRQQQESNQQNLLLVQTLLTDLESQDQQRQQLLSQRMATNDEELDRLRKLTATANAIQKLGSNSDLDFWEQADANHNRVDLLAQALPELTFDKYLQEANVKALFLLFQVFSTLVSSGFALSVSPSYLDYYGLIMNGSLPNTVISLLYAATLDEKPISVPGGTFVYLLFLPSLCSNILPGLILYGWIPVVCFGALLLVYPLVVFLDKQFEYYCWEHHIRENILYQKLISSVDLLIRVLGRVLFIITCQTLFDCLTLYVRRHGYLHTIADEYHLRTQTECFFTNYEEDLQSNIRFALLFFSWL